MAVGISVAVYLSTSTADDAVVVESLQTTAAYVRDVEHTLTFDGTVSTVTRTDPGATTLVLVAPVDALVLYDLVPSLDAGGVTTTVSITGRRGSFGCDSLTVLDPPSDGAVASPAESAAGYGRGGGGTVRADGAPHPEPDGDDQPGTSPTPGGEPDAEPSPVRVAAPELRCTVPEGVAAFAGLEATLKVAYQTPRGARRALSLPTSISSETSPDVVVEDHRSVRAAVDPALLFQLGPAIDAEQAMGAGTVVGRHDDFACEAVTLEDGSGHRVAAPPEQARVLAPPAEVADSGAQGGQVVACRVPADVVVYDGVPVRLQVSTARAADVLVVPLTAIRTSGPSTGVVALVTGTGADGLETTTNRAVTLGLDDGLVVTVTDGLVEGDVVVDPVSQR